MAQDQREYQKIYQAKNRDKLREYQREYQAKKRQEKRDAELLAVDMAIASQICMQPLEEIVLPLNSQDKRIIRKDHAKLKRALTVRKLKQKYLDYKGNFCLHCKGHFHPASYDFHHIDPAQKDFAISASIGIPWRIIKSELDKCILLCANCHRKHHAEQNEMKWLLENE